jgi:tetratricopeptide (TPR) repeat protein
MHDGWSAFFVRIFGSVFSLWIAFLGVPGIVTAQDPDDSAGPESLRLPEVVITGIDRSKIQRMLPKVDLAPELAILDTTLRDRSDALIQQGDLAFLRQVRQAGKFYAEALEIDPTNSTAFLRLGDVYRAQNKYVEAAQAYQQALALNAGLSEAYYHLGMLYELYLQDLPQAMEHYQAYRQSGGADPRVDIWIRNISRQLAGDTAVE